MNKDGTGQNGVTSRTQCGPPRRQRTHTSNNSRGEMGSYGLYPPRTLLVSAILQRQEWREMRNGERNPWVKCLLNKYKDMSLEP